MKLKGKTSKELLILHSEIINELKKRRVVRTSNNPVADYAEWLVAKRMNLDLTPNSNKSFDAVSKKGITYQIKARLHTDERKSFQLSVIRNLDVNKFDFLIGVIFNKDFSIHTALKVPHRLIKKLSTHSVHQNGYILQFRKNRIVGKGVLDISNTLKR